MNRRKFAQNRIVRFLENHILYICQTTVSKK